jgi:hypothetical protein
MPVHVGIGNARRVDVEVTFPNGYRRLIVKAMGVDPARYRGGSLVVRIPNR